jgi:proline iminopeptidase
VRSLVNKAFTPRSVEQLRPRVRELVRELAEPLRDRDGVGFLAEFAFQLPVIVRGPPGGAGLVGRPRRGHLGARRGARLYSRFPALLDRWLPFGGSWGSTLSLAYAERHPHRVSEIVIADVTTTRRCEIDWLYRGVARFFPAEWERFRVGVPGAGRDGDLVAAYARLMEDPDPQVRARAASDWCAWENAVLSLEPSGQPDPYSARPPAAMLAFVRICAHYFSHGAWLEEGALLRDARRLAGTPGVLIHGRLDLGSPPDTAWALARAWPDAELAVIADSGHKGSDTMLERILTALDTFARK